MLLHLYSRCFRIFKAALLIGYRPQTTSPVPDSAAVPRPGAPQVWKASAVDAQATLLGDAYRGSGVMVGSLGALIIFCAIAPVALGMSDRHALAFGIAEVVLMGLVIFILMDVRGLKPRWIETRSQAEVERYRPLTQTVEGFEQLQDITAPLLGGADCQIRYNQLKHDQYHHMEETTHRLSALGFGISLAAALSHLVIHASWMLLLTAFLPAAVGALHGVNAFLQLGQLSSEHAKMADQLGEMRQSLDRSRTRGDFQAARELVASIHELLTTHHTRWQDVAERIEVRAP